MFWDWLQAKLDVSDRTKIDIKGTNNTVIIGSGTNFYNLRIVVRGSNNILTIGMDCFIGGFIEIFGDGSEVVIGDRTRISSDVRLTAHAGKSIRIGSDCAIADLVDIRTTDSHSIINAQGDRLNPDASIAIGDRVWLAREVIILKGVVIGADVAIGIRSIVTKAIPANTVAVGIPAKVIRTETTWLVESI